MVRIRLRIPVALRLPGGDVEASALEGHWAPEEGEVGRDTGAFRVLAALVEGERIRGRRPPVLPVALGDVHASEDLP